MATWTNDDVVLAVRNCEKIYLSLLDIARFAVAEGATVADLEKIVADLGLIPFCRDARGHLAYDPVVVREAWHHKQRVEVVIDLHRAGMTNRDIAGQLRRSRKTVAAILRENLVAA